MMPSVARILGPMNLGESPSLPGGGSVLKKKNNLEVELSQVHRDIIIESHYIMKNFQNKRLN